jgi:hypothetical protein
MRRIMRPSADDAGQPTAAAPEPGAPIGEPNPGANPFARPAEAEPAAPVSPTDETAVLPVIGPKTAEQAAAEAEQPVQPEVAPPPRRRGLFRRRKADPPVPVEPQPAPVAEAAAVLPQPEGPAGLDPAEAEMRPPAGRRGHLRRRLRYLRRARELMLRDLGGLVYEIHRTAGGDMTSHAPVVTGKVERIRQLDGESVALETALGAPRGETVVFQPGIGGTCIVCGELYASSAHFCSECGTSTTQTQLPLAEAEPAPPPVHPRGTLNLFGRREPSADEPRPEESPAVEMPAEPGPAEEPAAAEQSATAEEPPPAEEPATAEEPPPAEEPATAEERPTETDTPASSEPEGNGTVPPTLQPGDPLASRERS